MGKLLRVTTLSTGTKSLIRLLHNIFHPEQFSVCSSSRQIRSFVIQDKVTGGAEEKEAAAKKYTEISTGKTRYLWNYKSRHPTETKQASWQILYVIATTWPLLKRFYLILVEYHSMCPNAARISWASLHSYRPDFFTLFWPP